MFCILLFSQWDSQCRGSLYPVSHQYGWQIQVHVYLHRLYTYCKFSPWEISQTWFVFMSNFGQSQYHLFMGVHLCFKDRVTGKTFFKVWEKSKLIYFWRRVRENLNTCRLQHVNATHRNIVGRNMLRAFGHHVAMCCNMLGVLCGPSLKMVKTESTTPNMSQHVATQWPNAHNMLRPTMLRYVALAGCDRLAGLNRPRSIWIFYHGSEAFGSKLQICKVSFVSQFSIETWIQRNKKV